MTENNQRSNNNNNNNNNRNPRNNRRRNNRFRRPNNGHRPGGGGGGGPIPMELGKIISKYENLLDQHLNARRKYYEQFHRVELEGRRRLEGVFFKTIEALREFESKLTPEMQDELKSHIDRYDEDNIYTENHNLPIAPPEQEVPKTGDDPHLLESQKKSNFSADREESAGSIEDYYNYKGVEAPVIPDDNKALKS